jgi:outer membrane lipoprotein-sorting protein
MKNKTLYVPCRVLAMVTGLLLCAQGMAESASSVLQKVDGYRQLAASFTMEMKLMDYDSGKLQEEMRMFGYFCGDDKSVLVVRNGKNKGMKVLLKGDDMWINLTGSKRGLRITPMQRLMGQASNGDIAKVSFDHDYSGTILKQDEAAMILELKAKSPGATYQRVVLTVHARNFRPEKAEFFLISGKHFKTATYLEFSRYENHEGVSKIKIQDQRNPTLYTIIEYGEYRTTQIPEKYFNVMFLPNLEVD